LPAPAGSGAAGAVPSIGFACIKLPAAAGAAGFAGATAPRAVGAAIERVLPAWTQACEAWWRAVQSAGAGVRLLAPPPAGRRQAPRRSRPFAPRFGLPRGVPGRMQPEAARYAARALTAVLT
jgi:hypothetical protein